MKGNNNNDNNITLHEIHMTLKRISKAKSLKKPRRLIGETSSYIRFGFIN